MFPSSGTGVSGNFWGHFKGAKYRFAQRAGGENLSWGLMLKIWKEGLGPWGRQGEALAAEERSW